MSARFCAFAQFIGGLGEVSIHVDIRYAGTDELVWKTEVHHLDFPNRSTLVQLVLTLEGCPFEWPGVYILELFCNNTWVCDTQVSLL